MQVKFCGFTQASDVQQAIELGADALGFVFYPPSPRAVTAEQAQSLLQQVPAFVSVVALVVNMQPSELVTLANSVDFDVIQFHGDESAELCQQLAKSVNKRWIKALRINQDTHDLQSIQSQIKDYAQAGASSILLDAYHKEAYGGTGERFDWSLIPKGSVLPIILAGGLTPDNVGDTLKLPIQAVDVSGGIESAKGIKDAGKMAAFIRSVKSTRWPS
ncbi:phosphoribosylanthranilate isomerase [Psychrobacter phenylpyruvicus]|uniref:N-(5'-phosphoribosyl)anthranilate isomerase n=1 Tax=Psychrobacter phenylpyruvicus TaxID=29432 RepID=A0A379LL62_9GAMM|nr:phosphoribosylanthranilate isomerase [Psychrobacter phenylpyruvicus]SUD91283.1 N-(5'-phosphoribosyl)anthranilate isomerase [Psychrobacter phenylpyruvicus]